MDLDARQTRNLFIAGTVAFPTPYSTTGVISLDVGQLTYSPGEPAKTNDLVISQELRSNRTVVRLMLQQHVSAIFVPGVRDSAGKFQISDAPRVDSLERGEWFVDTDVNQATVRARLKLKPKDDISTRNSILRGIVYIAQDRPLLRINEVALTAGDEYTFVVHGCTPCRLPLATRAGAPFDVPLCTPCRTPSIDFPEAAGAFGDWLIPVCTQCLLPADVPGLGGAEDGCYPCRCTCCFGPS